MKINGQQPPEFHGVKGGNSKENQKGFILATGIVNNLIGL